MSKKNNRNNQQDQSVNNQPEAEVSRETPVAETPQVVDETEAALDAKLDALKESKADSYVAMEPKPEEAKVEQPAQPTATPDAAKSAKRLGVESANRNWSVSPLGDRIRPSERLHAVTYFAGLLNETGVAVANAEAALLQVSKQAQQGDVSAASTAQKVCVYFDIFASQRGWDHFVRDTRLAMAGSLKGVEKGEVKADPRAEQPKVAAKPETAEDIEAAIAALLAKKAALQPAPETQTAQ